MDDAQTALDQAKAALAGADAQIAAAQANIGVLEAQRAEQASTLASLQLTRDKAQRDLSFTVLKAPYDGVVGNRSVEQGDLVSPGHIREYTVDEVVELGRAAGLEPGGWLTANYFETGSRANAVLRRLEPLVPRRQRAGITAWLQRPR